MDGNHYQYKSDEEAGRGDAQPMIINFEVSSPVGEVKVTNAKT